MYLIQPAIILPDERRRGGRRRYGRPLLTVGLSDQKAELNFFHISKLNLMLVSVLISIVYN